MALTDAYIDTNDLVQHLSSMGAITGEQNELMERAINAASRSIDDYCRRRFTTDTSATARAYRPEDCRTVWVHDFHTTTDLVVKTDTSDNGTFDTTWDSDDYELDPVNAISSTGEAWPYTTVHAVESRTFPTTGRRSRVQITAQWGWPAVPFPIAEACLLLSAKLYRRRQSPEGVIGFGEFGPVRISRRQDPDIVMMLDPYAKVGVLR